MLLSCLLHESLFNLVGETDGMGLWLWLYAFSPVCFPDLARCCAFIVLHFGCDIMRQLWTMRCEHESILWQVGGWWMCNTVVYLEMVIRVDGGSIPTINLYISFC